MTDRPSPRHNTSMTFFTSWARSTSRLYHHQRAAPWVAPRTMELMISASEAAVLEPGTRRTYDRFSRCTGCAQEYWRGEHGRRLESIVDRVTAAAGGPAGGRRDGEGSG